MQVCGNQSRILGIHHYTRGYKIRPKKIESVLNLKRLKDKNRVRQFLGIVQYYHDLWPKCSDILALLTELTKGRPTKYIPTKWTSDFTKEFQEMKALIAKETILAYPDLSERFTIHTDVLDVQLGAVIMQEGKPLAFYSLKLLKAELNYTMTEE